MVKKSWSKGVTSRRVLPGSFFLVGLFSFAASLVYMASGTLPLAWGGLFITFGIILIAASLRSLAQA